MRSQAEIRKFAANKYRDFLKRVVAGLPFEEIDVPFGRPNPANDLGTLIDTVKGLTENSASRIGFGYSVNLLDTPTRKHGIQRLPHRVYFATEDNYLRYLDATAEVVAFRKNLELTRRLCPVLMEWVPGNISKVLDYAKDWASLLEVCRWFMAHPRPQCYMREVPVSLHTKFIEERTAVLRSMLERCIPNDFDPLANDFPTRFYLKDKEPFVRLRIPDPSVRDGAGIPLSDFAVPVSLFQTLPLAHAPRIVVIENETNFLTLPPIAGTVYIWGEGNGVHRIGDAPWLDGGHRILYWGDVDSRGIMILSWLRRKLPKIRSIMMDVETLNAFPHAEVVDPVESTPVIDRGILRPEELVCYDALSQSRPRRRLEQERIPIEFAVKKITDAQ